MSKRIESSRLSESSSDDSSAEVPAPTLASKEKKMHPTSSAHPSTSKKRKHHATVAPVQASKQSAYEMFGTDSEDEASNQNDGVQSAGKSREKKRRAPSPARNAESTTKKTKPRHTSSSPAPPPESTPKKTKPQQSSSASQRLSAKDVFGSDSDDEEIHDQSLVCPPPASNNNSSNDLYKANCLSKNGINVSDFIRCQMCKIDLPRLKYRYHLRTNLHKSNCLIRTEFDNIDVIATAFKNRIVTYRINSEREVPYPLPETFLHHNKKNIINIIKRELQKHKCIKVNFELFAYFSLAKSDDKQLKSFNSKYEAIYNCSNLNDVFINMENYFKTKLSEFEQCESGWTYSSMSHLEINVNKYSPMRGGSYLELPLAIKRSRSCINIKNQDNHCFLWNIVAELYPAKSNVCKVTSYPHYSSVLNTKGMSFPPTPNDIKQFERNNPDISVNIYGLNKKSQVTGPLYMTTKRKLNHVNLLYIERNCIAHYCLIKDLVRLVRRQVTRHKGKVYLCESCLQFFNSELKYTSHGCNKILTTLPEKGSIMQFKNYERQQKIHFVIYADFECLLIDHREQNSSSTRTLKVHQPSCFGYYICCSHDSSLNKYVAYRGENCVEIFIQKLIKDARRINRILQKKNVMRDLTPHQEAEYQKATKCHICKQVLLGDKVRDHDHITSEYRGAAHSHCNLMHQVCSFIPIVLHNLSGYDSHLFITELAKYEGAIKIIPKSKEKYLSVTKVIECGVGLKPIELKFIDSFHFLSSSIDDLSKSLCDIDFINLSREFKDESQINLLRKKGVYPYDYMDAWSKFDETHLPQISGFYNSLNAECISSEQYEFANTVWNCFNIKTLGEYTDLYLKCDVLLLCDIFEKFRKTSLFYYKLDPAYYITSPSLSFDAMLFYTGVKLELINDLEIYHMLENGIRGGLAQCSLRHAMASNKYLPNYDESEQSSYLIYLDCNNLYGYAMTKNYPISEFMLLPSHEIEIFNVMNIPDDSNYGFILEVDLGYPDHLHDMHSDLPFAAEKFKPPGGKTEKLIANLYDKFNYVIHYVHLKECIKNGLELRKIHRILRFRQQNYLKKYIDLNTSLRQSSKTAFEKDFFKLLNNSIFGKTIENRRKQVDVKLVTTWNDTKNVTNKHLSAEKLITKPNLKNITIFSENFVAIQLQHEKLILDRPIYIGFTVLEYAKQHMYQFHYDYMTKKYNGRIHLCYTDTDSLLYLIYTRDFYDDMRNDNSQFDTSNFPLNNVYDIKKANEKVPGLFKDEMAGDIIKEFIGLRAKLYCINSVKNNIMKAKGISKSVTKRLRISDYNEALYQTTDDGLKCKMNLIRSIKHILYTQQVDKQIFSRNDDKRQVLKDNIHTLPWGHCDTIF